MAKNWFDLYPYLQLTEEPPPQESAVNGLREMVRQGALPTRSQPPVEQLRANMNRAPITGGIGAQVIPQEGTPERQRYHHLQQQAYGVQARRYPPLYPGYDRRSEFEKKYGLQEGQEATFQLRQKLADEDVRRQTLLATIQHGHKIEEIAATGAVKGQLESQQATREAQEAQTTRGFEAEQKKQEREFQRTENELNRQKDRDLAKAKNEIDREETLATFEKNRQAATYRHLINKRTGLERRLDFVSSQMARMLRQDPEVLGIYTNDATEEDYKDLDKISLNKINRYKRRQKEMDEIEQKLESTAKEMQQLTPGRPITMEEAQAILDEAGGDPEEARNLARERGLTF